MFPPSSYNKHTPSRIFALLSNEEQPFHNHPRINTRHQQLSHYYKTINERHHQPFHYCLTINKRRQQPFYNHLIRIAKLSPFLLLFLLHRIIFASYPYIDYITPILHTRQPRAGILQLTFPKNANQLVIRFVPFHPLLL